MPVELIKLRNRLQKVWADARVAVGSRSLVVLDEHGKALPAEAQEGYISKLQIRLAALDREIEDRENPPPVTRGLGR